MLLFSAAKIATTTACVQSENMIIFDFKIGFGYTWKRTENHAIFKANL